MAVLPLPARVAGALVRGRVAAAFSTAPLTVARFAGARVPVVRRSVAAACRRFVAGAVAAFFPTRRGFVVATGVFTGCRRTGVAVYALVVVPGFLCRAGVAFDAMPDVLPTGAFRRPLADVFDFTALLDAGPAVPAVVRVAGLEPESLLAAGCLFAAAGSFDLTFGTTGAALVALPERLTERRGLPFDGAASAGATVTGGISADRFAGRFALPTRSLLPLFRSATRRSVARPWFG